MQETVAGLTTKYIVGEVNPTGYAQVFAELSGTNSLVRGYMWGLQLEAQRDFSDGTFIGRISYYGLDGHGSVRYLTNPNGAITDTYDYDAFGNQISSTGTTFNNYLFAGEQFDPALGIYYNRARYYDQRQGRFWTADMYQGDNRDPLTLHKYVYSGNDPIDRIDPTGQFSIEETTTVAAITNVLALQYAPLVTSTLRLAIPKGHIAGKVLTAVEVAALVLAAGSLIRLGFRSLNFITNLVRSAPEIEAGAAAAETAATIIAEETLSSSAAASFEGGIYTKGFTSDNLLVYRVEGGFGSGPFGRFFGFVKPSNAADAEALYNISKYGNEMTSVVTYRVPPGTKLFVGKVAGGAGDQAFIPEPIESLLQVVSREPLPPQ